MWKYQVNHKQLENSNSFLLQYYETTYTKLYRDAVKLARGLPSWIAVSSNLQLLLTELLFFCIAYVRVYICMWSNHYTQAITSLLSENSRFWNKKRKKYAAPQTFSWPRPREEKEKRKRRHQQEDIPADKTSRVDSCNFPQPEVGDPLRSRRKWYSLQVSVFVLFLFCATICSLCACMWLCVRATVRGAGWSD